MLALKPSYVDVLTSSSTKASTLGIFTLGKSAFALQPFLAAETGSPFDLTVPAGLQAAESLTLTDPAT